MKTGIVICSRLNSSRVPNKAIYEFDGVPLIKALVSRVINHFPVVVAVPTGERNAYNKALSDFIGKDGFSIYSGSPDDPLERMYHASKKAGFDRVIRICHDKIFVCPHLIELALKAFDSTCSGYLYSSMFTEGTGFEIMTFKALKMARKQFKNVEHISYAVRAVTNKIHNFDVPEQYRSEKRLLIDYKEDLPLIEHLASEIGLDAPLTEVIEYVNNAPLTMRHILPTVTVYTCAKNASKWINECITSVLAQKDAGIVQYILVDDCSTDDTLEIMNQYKNICPIIVNKTNLGLASSSNVALSKARGKYIIRLDADDYFLYDHALSDMIKYMDERGLEALYPDNDFEQKGWDNHHVGGSMFLTKAVNHVKFTDGLRGYEGLDFFERAKNQLKIGYFHKEVFHYRQTPKSMSKTNTRKRRKLKDAILSGSDLSEHLQ